MRRHAPLLIVLLVTIGSCSPSVLEPRATRVRAAPAARARVALPEHTLVVASTGLRRIESCTALLTHVRDAAAKIVTPWGVRGYRSAIGRSDGIATGIGMAMASRAVAGATAAHGASAHPAPPRAPGDAFSRTNVQEEDVDEPDVVKTDGRAIFVLPWVGPRRLLAVAPGDRPTIIGSVGLEDGHDKQILLDGDRAIVIGPGSYERRAKDGTTYAVEGTHVTVIDVADPRAMRILRRVHFEGGMVSARLHAGVAWFVVRSNVLHIPFVHPGLDGRNDAAATRENQSALATTGLDDWVPHYRANSHGRTAESRLGGCEDTYVPEVFSGLNRTTVVTLDPRHANVTTASTLVADAQTVYASTTSVYAATSQWHDPAFGPAPEHVTTQIHRFDVSDPRAPRYVATGGVPGILLNQWSMSEHDGHLRVASTVERGATAAASSVVTILQTRGSALVNTGQVTGLGVGERIYAVRFMGDIGYVVTFRRIDPLYAIDLSDPARPRVVGELKIPGYSSYLHPIGDGLLLGLGQDANEDSGWILGLQAAIFDVSDPRRPRQVAKLRIDNGRSHAEFDHRAFLWWDRERLAIVPVAMQEEDGTAFVGAVALRATDRTMREAARITHDRFVYPERYASPKPSATPEPTPTPSPAPTSAPGLTEPAEAAARQLGLLPTPEPTPAASAKPRWTVPVRSWRWQPHATIDRSLVIGGVLYTLSGAGLLATDLETLSDTTWLALA